MFTAIFTTVLFLIIGFYFIFSDKIIRSLASLVTKDSEMKNKSFSFFSKLVGLTIVIFSVVSTSFIYIPSKTTGQLTKRVGGVTLEKGKIIAINGELGRQGEIFSEGLHFKPFLNIMYNIDEVPNIIIPSGKIGVLVARDGRSLEGFVSDKWSNIVEDKNIKDLESKMLDAEFFLTHNGQKGPQLNVLTPGEYKINRFLFDIKIAEALVVPAGFVAVITSRVGKIYKDTQEKTGNDSLATPLVPVGYVGIWEEPLMPNAYYQEANPYAYASTLFNTKIQTWVYKGGFTEREIIVSLSPDGKILQRENEIKHPLIESAADRAISVKSNDGWVIHIEARMQVQAEPAYAPRIIASVGSLENMEDRVITPILRSVLRNEGEKREAVEFLNSRSKIESEVNDKIISEARKAGISVKDLRITHISIPPALLVPKKRTQLATQMLETYKQEKSSYDEQVKSNKVKALAEQQAELVMAQIEKEKAKEFKEMQRLKGEGVRLFLEEKAKGQKAIADVLGTDKAYELQVIDKIAQMLRENPNLATTPMVYSVGGSNGAGVSDSAASILAIQELKKGLSNVSTIKEK